MAYPSSFSSSISSFSSRKRLWSPEEDKILTECVEKYGTRYWNKLARVSGLRKSGNSCRCRWMNHLNPKVNRGDFTKEEDEIIIKAHRSYGNQWSKIALKLIGRTDNQIKNRWNTHLSKKEVVSKEDGIPNHIEIHQNISNELVPGHEFHPDFFNEFFLQNISYKPTCEKEFHPICFDEPFPDLESYQYLPHNSFLEDEKFSPRQDFFPETFSEPEFLPHNPFLEDEKFSPHQDFFPEIFSEPEYLLHEPFPENQFQLWNFPSTTFT